MLLSSSDTRRTLVHLFLFTNSAQRELVSICTRPQFTFLALVPCLVVNFPLINPFNFKADAYFQYGDTIPPLTPPPSTTPTRTLSLFLNPASKSKFISFHPLLYNIKYRTFLQAPSQQLHRFCKPSVSFKALCENLSNLAVLSSYHILRKRKTLDWDHGTPFLKPTSEKLSYIYS